MVTIKIKRTTGSGPGTLAYGELGYREGEKSVYVGDQSGTPVLVGGALKQNRDSGITAGRISVAGSGGVLEGYAWLTVNTGNKSVAIGDGASGSAILNLVCSGSNAVVEAVGTGAGIIVQATASGANAVVRATGTNGNAILQATGANGDVYLSAASGRVIHFQRDGTELAGIHGAGLYIYGGSTYSVTLGPGAGMSGNISVSFFNSLPSGDAIVHVNAAGQLSWVPA